MNTPKRIFFALLISLVSLSGLTAAAVATAPAAFACNNPGCDGE